MPYRRLPNTDQARIRTLKAAVAKGESCDIRELPFSINTLALARAFLNKFEIARSKERRVGKECLCPCRSRWAL